MIVTKHGRTFFDETDVRWLTEAAGRGVDHRQAIEVFSELWDQEIERWQAIYNLRRDAFRLLRITKAHRAFHGGDHDQIRGFDVAAQTLTWEHPILGMFDDDGLPAKLFELLLMGEEDYRPDADRVWQRAIDEIEMGRRPCVLAGDDVPF